MQDLTQHPRYSLLIGFVVFLSFMLTVGITQYSFGVFVTQLEQDLGWSRAEVSSALSFFAMVGVAALPVGWLLDRYGARPVMTVSLVMLGVSQVLRPFMTELWQFYALTALQFAAMPGAVILVGPRLIGLWFEATRGRAMGLTGMGANFGGIVFSSLTATLITSIGWRASYAVYGVLFWLLVPVVLLVVREPVPHTVDEDPSRPVHASLVGVTLRDALRSRMFYLVVIALLLAQSTYQSVLPQLVPHLQNVGMSRSTAAAALSVLALFGMSGKVLFGWFCERRPARVALMISMSLQATGLIILLAAGSSPIVWAFVPVFGLGLGALGAILPLLVQETFGLLAFSVIFGLVNFLTLASALVGPPLVGASFDATGSYRTAFIGLAIVFVLAAIVVSFTRPLNGARRQPVSVAVAAE